MYLWWPFFLWKIQVVEYQVGDVLEVLPGQNPAFVDAFIKRCKLDPDSYITVCDAIPFSSSACTYMLLSISSLSWPSMIIVLRSQYYVILQQKSTCSNKWKDTESKYRKELIS